PLVQGTGALRGLHPVPTRRSSDLRPEEKLERSRLLVFDVQYDKDKQAILASVNKFQDMMDARLLADVETARANTSFAVKALGVRSEEHTSELQSRENLVCRLLLEK